MAAAPAGGVPGLPRVLVLGGGLFSDHLAIAEALTNRHHKRLSPSASATLTAPAPPPPAPAPAASPPTPSFEASDWRVETKYYAATVRVEARSSLDAIAALDDEAWWDGVQAVVLAVDMRQPREFIEAHGSLLARLEDIDTLICVGVLAPQSGDDGAGPAADEAEQALESVDPTLEFVPVDLHSPQPVRALPDGSKIGLDRVVEALEVTMWHNMERAGAAHATDSAASLDSAGAQTGAAAPAAPNAPHRGLGSAAGAASASAPLASNLLDRNQEGIRGEAVDVASVGDDEDVAAAAVAAAALEPEPDIDNLASLMDEVRRVKSLHGTRSHEAHVREATLVAMRLAAAMGLDADEEDEEDGADDEDLQLLQGAK